jgi:predicted DNA-binding protein (UPF0278 family)
MEDYGKADPHILKVYDMVCQWRVKDTVAFMESRFKEHAEKEAQTSILKKFGRLLTNLFIGIVVLMMVGPTVYEIYEK